MRNSEILYVRIPPDLMVELDDMAEASNTSRNSIVIILLTMVIAHLKRDQILDS